MRLHDLSPENGARKSGGRVGRGVGSGWGKTSGKGSKGLKARSGGGVRPGFEGGQMPIHRRLPKRGFTNIFKKNIKIVNVQDLTRFTAGEIVDGTALVRVNLVKGSYDGIKLLGKGDISIPLTVKLDAVSAQARTKIEAAGGPIA